MCRTGKPANREFSEKQARLDDTSVNDIASEEGLEDRKTDKKPVVQEVVPV